MTPDSREEEIEKAAREIRLYNDADQIYVKRLCNQSAEAGIRKGIEMAQPSIKPVFPSWGEHQIELLRQQLAICKEALVEISKFETVYNSGREGPSIEADNATEALAQISELEKS